MLRQCVTKVTKCASQYYYIYIFSFSMMIQKSYIYFLPNIFSQQNYFSFPTWIRNSQVCSWGKLESNMSAKMWISLGMNQYVIRLFFKKEKNEFHQGCIIFQGLTLKGTRYIQLSKRMKFNHLNIYFVLSCAVVKRIILKTIHP